MAVFDRANANDIFIRDVHGDPRVCDKRNNNARLDIKLVTNEEVEKNGRDRDQCDNRRDHCPR